MAEPTTLGSWLRRERERRGITLAQIAEDTKVAVPLLQGLEADDLSRWPGGIFRRAFVRSYATAIGLDAELVLKRIEEEHPSEPVEATTGNAGRLRAIEPAVPERRAAVLPATAAATIDPVRLRVTATLLDLLVAGAIGLGFAAAGSRLLWPVLVIAAYHAAGMLLAGRSPVMALLSMQPRASVVPQPQPQADVQPERVEAPAAVVPREAESAAQPRRADESRPARRARARRSHRHDQAAARH